MSGEAIKEIQNDLDWRHEVASQILGHMKKALAVYEGLQKPSVSSWLDSRHAPESVKHINTPRCSKEHLSYIVKELTEYTEELDKVRRGLPRLLENGTGMDVD